MNHPPYPLKITRRQALAFRLDSHHLAERLEPGSLSAAAGACGLQNTPPGAAALALHARLNNLEAQDVTQALEQDKSLLQAWSLRASPYIFPLDDWTFFTLGLLPEDEDSTRFFIYAVEAALAKTGVSAMQVVDWVAVALLDALDGQALTKDALGVDLARRTAAHLSAAQRLAWDSPSWYAAGQSLGESVVRFALPIMALKGLCCHGERRGEQAYIVRCDQWINHPPKPSDRLQAQAGLVRRYLHCFGPSTPRHFGEWAGISPNQAAQAWGRIESELAAVDFEGHQAWLLERDLERMASPRQAEGVRFLPPHDPYKALRDRATLIPDRTLQKTLWKAIGNPGVLLVDGQAAAAWRPSKKGKRLKLAVDSFEPISGSAWAQIESEGRLLAAFRGCDSVEITSG